jgi:CheY-like chemotaxis protein
MSKIERNILKGWDVLVVDDELDSQEVAKRLLKRYGATVYTADNGLEALDVLKTIQPVFILSDISMPELDGWGLIYELQQNRDTAEIPIFALTAHAMRGDRERAMAVGFFNYLTKPLTPATFMESLLSIMRAVPQLEAKLAVL